MPLTPSLVRALEAAALAHAAAVKADWARRIQAVLTLVDPPLTPRELSLGLGLELPATTSKARSSPVARWLSSAPRSLHSLPDARVQALIERVEQGLAVLAIARAPGLDGARIVTFAEVFEVEHLGPDVDVVRMIAGRPGALPLRDSERPGDAQAELPLSAKVPLAPRPLGRDAVLPLGLGAMRLATAGHPPVSDGMAIIRRACERGLRLIDTADAYALDERDAHAGERLIRQALASWPSAERAAVVVATKAGLVRPGGRWLPSGRPEHLVASCLESCRALGVDALPLWQLHAKDPRVPFEESLGALADMVLAGHVAQLGLCNVGVDDVWTALRVLPKGSLVSVQNALNPFEARAAVGVLALTRELGLAFLAHSPLGGHRGTQRIERRPALFTAAERHQTTPQAMTLAYLLDLAPHVIPLFGATRVDSVDGSCAALGLRLGDDDRQELDQAFPELAELRTATAPREPPPLEVDGIDAVSSPLPPPGDAPEVVMIMGIQGAGKSTLVTPYVQRGYLRLNRDTVGGTLDGLLPRLANALAGPDGRVVLDNTYPLARQRAGVIQVARAAGVPVRLLWLDTSLAEARWNIALRMLARHGRLLGPDEIKVIERDYADTVPPQAQERWLAALETPRLSEGLDQLERRPFVRSLGSQSLGSQALLIDVDGALRVSRAGDLYPREPDDVVLLPGRRQALLPWLKAGYRLFFVGNQSGIQSGRVTRAQTDACFQRTIELLGLPVDDVVYCPHQAFPIGCFCRLPMPGLATQLVVRHGLDQRRLVVVGDLDSDRAFADGIGARHLTAAAFFDPDQPVPPL